MTETPWSAWFDEVVSDVPGSPSPPLVTNAVRNAAIEFCDRSWVYRVELDPMPGEENVPDYALESPIKKTVVVKVLRLWYDKKEIYPKTQDDLASMYAHWPSQAGTPQWFTQRDPEVLLLVPMPAATLVDALSAQIAIKPSRVATCIDTAIYEKYLEEIAHGAKARLFAMSRKPWSDAKLQADHQAQFTDAIGRARVQAVRGHTRARLRMKAHFF